jgi:zinc protease
MRTLSVSAAALLIASAAAAQKSQPIDRAVQPTPGAAKALQPPKWTKTKLANGADLVVVERHDLPLVAFNINFVGGAVNFEPADKVGLASFTAAMMTEGTTTRNADQLSDAQQRLGVSIFPFVGQESGSIQLGALADKFEPALALLADIMLHPAFPADALERMRGQRLISFTQQKDSPNGIAANVFPKLLYGNDHPYGRTVTEQGIRSVTREDLIAFHKAYFQPGRAVITVTGDVNAQTVKSKVEKALAEWKAGGSRPAFDYPALPPAKATTIYLVDKPKAAQSVFAIGLPGPPRSTPDYYAIQVMNNILGVLFQSRINHNIREVKGYSYGARSSFAYGRGPGPFQAGGGIVTAKSDSALIEFMKELKGVQGGIPFTADEIEQGKSSLIQGLPNRFASVNGTGNSIGTIYTEGLPESYYADYAAKINAVTSDDLVRVAKKYIDLDHLNILIVGDRAVIENPLRATKIAPIVILDPEGKPVVVP